VDQVEGTYLGELLDGKMPDCATLALGSGANVLGGGGPRLTDSQGTPFTAAYIDTIGQPAADLRSDIAAEARAKIVYERLINVTDDPGVKEALGFLMTREVAHQKSFEKALYSIEPNFPPGKLPAAEKFASVYFDMSQGPGNQRGPWNQGELWDFVDDPRALVAVDGEDGSATVQLEEGDATLDAQLTERTASITTKDPLTGAELGAGEGAGRVNIIEKEDDNAD
jgi:Mn-containing catalase